MSEFLTISLIRLAKRNSEAERLYHHPLDETSLQKLTDVAYRYGKSIGLELMYIYPATIKATDHAYIVYKILQEQPA